jgi:hypothetical protein
MFENREIIVVIIMKRLVLVIVLLVVAVSASGCTSQNISNKTYSANGVSFIYPGNWSEQNATSLETELGSTGDVLAVVGNGSNYKFGFAKLNIGSNQRVATLSEWASNYNSTMRSKGSTYVSEKSSTVNGVKAYQLTMQSAGTYVTDVFFVKNGTGYLAVYASKSNDTEILDQLMQSLNVTK